MRTTRTTFVRVMFGALAVAGAAIAGGIGAASASALELAPLSEFVASPMAGKEFPLKIRGEGIGPQEFTFKRLKVTCQVAKVHGEVADPTSKTLQLQVKFKECAGGPFDYGNIRKVTLPVGFKEKATLTYHYGGWVESGEEVDVVTRYLKCLTAWYAGTYPEKAEEKPLSLYPDAKYKTEEVANGDAKAYPSGVQQKLLIANEIKGKGLEWEEEGGGACEGEEVELAEGERGKYAGKLMVEVHNGDIAFKEPI